MKKGRLLVYLSDILRSNLVPQIRRRSGQFIYLAAASLCSTTSQFTTSQTALT